MNYTKEIISLAMWPILILVTYLIVLKAIKYFNRRLEIDMDKE
jgi:hypothetical protein